MRSIRNRIVHYLKYLFFTRVKIFVSFMRTFIDWSFDHRSRVVGSFQLPILQIQSIKSHPLDSFSRIRSFLCFDPSFDDDKPL